MTFHYLDKFVTGLPIKCGKKKNLHKPEAAGGDYRNSRLDVKILAGKNERFFLMQRDRFIL